MVQSANWSYHSGRSSCVVHLLRLDSYMFRNLHMLPCRDRSVCMTSQGDWRDVAYDSYMLQNCVYHDWIRVFPLLWSTWLCTTKLAQVLGTWRGQKVNRRGPLDQFLVTVKKNPKTVFLDWYSHTLPQQRLRCRLVGYADSFQSSPSLNPLLSKILDPPLTVGARMVSGIQKTVIISYHAGVF